MIRPTLAVAAALVALSACQPSHYPPLPDGGCTHQHPTCVSNAGTAGDFDAGCGAGFACFPDKARACSGSGPCDGFCVQASGSGRWSGHCEACGSCVFSTGGFVGFSAPEGCASTSMNPPNCADCGGSCELD